MKIEVGKKYKTENGLEVKIISNDSGVSGYPFLGELTGESAHRSFTADGKWNKEMNSGLDIVSEVIEPSALITPDIPAFDKTLSTRILRFARGGDLEWVADALKKNPDAKFSLLGTGGKIIRSGTYGEFDWSTDASGYALKREPIKVYSQVILYSYTTLADFYYQHLKTAKTYDQLSKLSQEFLSEHEIKEYKLLPVQEIEL